MEVQFTVNDVYLVQWQHLTDAHHVNQEHIQLMELLVSLAHRVPSLNQVVFNVPNVLQELMLLPILVLLVQLEPFQAQVRLNVIHAPLVNIRWA